MPGSLSVSPTLQPSWAGSQPTACLFFTEAPSKRPRPRESAYTRLGKPQAWLGVNLLMSWKASGIPGMLAQSQVPCPTISQPHNDSPSPFAWVSKFAGQRTPANQAIMTERRRRGKRRRLSPQAQALKWKESWGWKLRMEWPEKLGRGRWDGAGFLATVV